MSDTTQQPIELHCRAVLHLSPEHFTIRVPSRAYPFYHYQARGRLGDKSKPHYGRYGEEFAEALKPDPKNLLCQWLNRGQVVKDDARGVYLKC